LINNCTIGYGISPHGWFAHPHVTRTQLAKPSLRGRGRPALGGEAAQQRRGGKVESLEINRAAVSEVGPNDDFGLKVIEHAREHDAVFKVAS